jgi:hypothetical protein
MTMYSRHTVEELEALRAPAREAAAREHARGRIEAKRGDLQKQIENVKVLCAELVDLVDIMDSGREDHLKVDLRSLSERLQLAENELLAATDQVAEQMGVVGMAG